MTQPGYDALATRYSELFPTAFQSPLERHAFDMFAETVLGTTSNPSVIDVGCGLGHVAHHLETLGFGVIGVDPSPEMLRIARNTHPDIDFRSGDAHLSELDVSAVDAILARFSLIHVAPAVCAEVLTDWCERLPANAIILLAVQSADEPGVHEFDHAVAPAWRWHPDELGRIVTAAGFDELWRVVARPDADLRFGSVHLCAVRAPHSAE